MIADLSDPLLTILNINFMISLLSITNTAIYHAQVQANHRLSGRRQDQEHSVCTVAS